MRDYCGEINSLPESAILLKLLSANKKKTFGSLKREDGTWTIFKEASFTHAAEFKLGSSFEA